MTVLPHELRAWLIAHVAGLRGLDARAIDPAQPFSRYGLDSLEATRLARSLGERLGCKLPVTLAWEHPSIEAVVSHLTGCPVPRDRTADGTCPVPRDRTAHGPVAIIGLACRFPGAPDLDAFWGLLRDGRDAIREVPPGRWDAARYHDPDPSAPGKHVTRRAGFLDSVDLFDPLFFGISPREAPEIDPQQRLALELAWEALEHAGVDSGESAGRRTGVFMGVIWRDYTDLAGGDLAAMSSHRATGQALNMVANRVSYALGLEGPSLVIDTACSSSLVAIHLACQSLWAGDCDLALAGGVNLILAPDTMVALTKFGGLAPDGRSKAFDARADGFGRGEGAGLVVLKPLERARADGDTVHAVIRGSAVNNDGPSNGLTAPNPRAQVDVLAQAYRRAGMAPAAVHYVETHGTGTVLGDPIEAGALGEVLGPGRDPGRPLVIGSVKASIGHLEGAAGIAGVIKTVLMGGQRAIPPSPHFEQPNPHIAFDELNIALPRDGAPWPAADSEPALAGVSSFGWGGTNAHVVLEVPPPDPRWAKLAAARGQEPPAERPMVVLVCSPQGSQWVGMGRALLEGEPAFRDAFLRVDRAFAAHAGVSLAAELGRERFEGVSVIQPLLFALQVALAAQWRAWGLTVDAVIGHSLGEVVAAHITGILDLEDATRVIHHYSRLQQLTADQGGMALVDLGADALRGRLDGRVVVAGENSFRSTVLAGDPAALRELLTELKAEDVSCSLIRVNVAAHSAQMDPILGELATELAGLRPARAAIPMLSTVSAEWLAGPEVDASYICANLRRPVRLAAAVERLLAEATRPVVLLELGGQPVLGYALEQTVARAGRPATVLTSLRSGDERLALADARARLFALGALEAEAAAPRVLPLSARSPEALREAAGRMADWLGQRREIALDDVCYTAAVRRGHLERRVAVTGSTRDEMIAALAGVARGGPLPAARAGGVTFVFTGQGSTWPGMLRGLADLEVARATLARLAPLIERHGGPPLGDIDGRLAETAVAQPALFALQLALAAQLADWGITPSAVIGHSVGEVAAAVVCGALDLEDGVRLVCRRGQLMQRAHGLGAMAAVALDPEAARAALVGLDGRLAVAALNDPGAVVLSGEAAALDDVLARLRMRGVRCRPLDVAYAFHGPGMGALGDELEAEMAGLAPRPPRLPMLSTVTGGPATSLDAAYWGRNVREPVDFLGALRAAGPGVFVEVGPHAALTPSVTALFGDGAAVATLRRGQDTRRALAETVAALHGLGQPIDWRRVAPPGRVVPLPAYPWQRRRYWIAPPAERRAAAPRPSLGPPVQGWRLDGPIDAARFAALAAEAARELEGPTARAEELTFVPDGDVSACQLVVDGATLRLLGRAASGAWRELGRARVAAGERELDLRWVERAVGAAPCPARWLVLEDGAGDGGQGAALAALLGGSLGPADLGDVDGVVCLRSRAEAVLDLMAEIAAAPRPPRLWLVTRGAQAVGGAPLFLAQAPLWGLGRAFALEHPEAWGGLIDLDPAVTDMAAELGGLASALRAGEPELALRGGACFVPRLEPCPSPAATSTHPLTLRADATYLVTGGLGGLGLAFARWLIAHGARHLLLIGRSGASGLSPARRAALAALGGQVTVAACDVADAGAMERLLAAVEPPLAGVIHAAGVATWQLLDAPGSRAALADSMHAKVRGALVLDELTRGRPLDLFILCSSVASLWGGRGQGHYAAANQVLDALAHERRRRGLPALSCNFGLWAEGGMAAAESDEGQRLRAAGLVPMASEVALAAVERALADGVAQRAVAQVDWPRFRALYESRGPRPLLERLPGAAAPTSAAPVATPLRARIQGALPAQARQLLHDLVLGEVRRVLAYAPDQAPAGGRGFFDLGMDSLMVTQLSQALGAALGQPVPTALAFDHPNIGALAAALADLLVPAAPAPGDDDDDLSEDELGQLLAAKLARPPRAAVHE